MTRRSALYWTTTAFLAIAFLVPGVGNIIHASHIASDMAHLGYPSYFLYILGCWKVLGAIAILVPGLPRLKEWAYAGMIFDLTGAAASRAAVGDKALMIVVPLLIGSVALMSWSLRPRGRKLEAQAS
jgi:uncharacterized membrane protein YphA (DoxX/SURF4 family)